MSLKILITAITFSLLTMLVTPVLAASLSSLLGLGGGIGLLILIGALTFVAIIRAPLPRLALARGLMIFATGLITIPIQTILIAVMGFTDISIASNAGQLARLVELISNWMASVSAAVAVSGAALAIAPMLFVFGWAYATKSQDDT